MKIIGNTVYTHRSNLGNLPESFRKAAETVVDFPWDYVKYNRETGSFTFVRCEGWDILPEPVCLSAIKVDKDGSKKQIVFSKDNPFVIHGKHLFVSPNYTGFDLKEAEARWDSYQNQPWLDKKRMGFRKWWVEKLQ